MSMEWQWASLTFASSTTEWLQNMEMRKKVGLVSTPPIRRNFLIVVSGSFFDENEDEVFTCLDADRCSLLYILVACKGGPFKAACDLLTCASG